VVLNKNDLWKQNHRIEDELAIFKHTKVIYYSNDDELVSLCKDVDAVILAYWGEIIKGDLFAAPKFGFINLHTSYLPYGKGKHPHYWSIVEEKPYGVTIMKIDSGLDTGKIIFQKEIKVSWLDTGKSLYFKAFKAIYDLLMEKKKQILELKFELMEQENEGTFHYGKEIENNSLIILDKKYTARNLLNIIRARTFPPFPAAYFIENGKKFEVTVQINEVNESLRENNIDYEKILNENAVYIND
jgi:methionyl-tRNA formyltransferase